jgi:GTP-binding protein Era
VPNAEIYPIRLQNFNVQKFSKIISLLPESPAYYPKDQLTDSQNFVNETIREKILLNYSKEIPYAVELYGRVFEDETL